MEEGEREKEERERRGREGRTSIIVGKPNLARSSREKKSSRVGFFEDVLMGIIVPTIIYAVKSTLSRRMVPGRRQGGRGRGREEEGGGG